MNTRHLILGVCLLAICAAPATAQRSRTGAKAYEQLRNTFNSASDASSAARRQSSGTFAPTTPVQIPKSIQQATWKAGAQPPNAVDLNSLRRPAPPSTPPPAVQPGARPSSVTDAGRQSANALNDLKNTDTTKLGMRAKQDHGAQVRKAEENVATSRAAVQRSYAEADAFKKKKQNKDFVTEKKRQEGKASEAKLLEDKKFQERKVADAKRYEEKKALKKQAHERRRLAEKKAGEKRALELNGRIKNVDPHSIRFSQTTAGGGGRAAVLRESMQKGWNGPPVDVVKTNSGLVTIDNTRVAIARELEMKAIPVTVRLPDETLPKSMDGRFGSASSWGEALRYRTGNQRPALPPSGTIDLPKLP